MANVLFQNAIHRVPQNIPPIWMMRQAGRYHKHYQALRAKYGFMELCKQSELAAEVTLGPIAEFDFDVAILFSDLLFPLEAMGFGLEYSPSPKLGKQLNDQTINELIPVDEAIGALEFQRDAVIACREVLPDSKSLIGFVGGPWTLFTYAVEGSHSGHLLNSKNNFNLYQSFCEKLVPLLKKNIQIQLDGGAEVIMLFDTAAGELSPGMYKKWVQPALESLVTSFPGKLGYYSKGTQLAHVESLICQSDWAGFGFDHRWDLPSTFPFIDGGFVQGNFDQALLFSEEYKFPRRLKEFLAPFKELSTEERAGWICGLGHGVLPKTPEKNVKAFVDIVREEFA